ncbi:hypothetical protein G3I39_25005 [Streptomyces fulvissimus]|uniref:Uncharacterized protein n=1 Tax=Streptomyces microflavus TaxID=1919 RepID=A0A6N9VG71_STRMI|nr:hypothetical protein [Streptomyces microflavus]NEB70288.1 hypothetical protein [Streptomyces microflavus]
MQLPEPYQQQAPVGQPRPAYTRLARVELYTEREPIVYVPNAYGEMVPMLRSQAPSPIAAPQPRDLTPLPLIDPLAARMAGAGIGAGAAGAGVGWGLGQAFAGIATMGGATAIAAIALLLLAAKVPAIGRGSSTTNIHNETHNHNTWWGHSSTGH